MKLSVVERIKLMDALPQESNYLTFRILTELRTALSFSEKEMKDFKIEQKEGKIFWERSKEKEKDVVVGEQALIIIKAALTKVDKENKVNEFNKTLFDKFMPEIGLEVQK